MSGSKMFAEIHEQPEVLERILDEGWGEISSATRVLRQGNLRSVMIAARGTSDNAALYAKYLFEILLGVPTALASPSSFTLYESKMNLDGVLVMGISQSGESQDVLETIRRSGELGANTLTVTNNEESAMAKVAQHHFFLRAGREESVAATKTYTAELMMLYLLVSALKGEESLEHEVRQLPGLSRQVLEVEWEGTERYRYAEYMVVTARGYNLATAEEAALKLMETTYIVAQAFSAADLRHGPMAMIGYDFPVLVIAPLGRSQPGMRDLVENLRERGAELVVVSDERTMLDKASARFHMPDSLPEELSLGFVSSTCPAGLGPRLPLRHNSPAPVPGRGHPSRSPLAPGSPSSSSPSGRWPQPASGQAKKRWLISSSMLSMRSLKARISSASSATMREATSSCAGRVTLWDPAALSALCATFVDPLTPRDLR